MNRNTYNAGSKIEPNLDKNITLVAKKSFLIVNESQKEISLQPHNSHKKSNNFIYRIVPQSPNIELIFNNPTKQREQ